MVRRFIPFGSHWGMGIDVPYSLAIVDHGRFWSCGQCPLDQNARSLFPGRLRQQLGLVAERIIQQFAPHLIAPDQISKLVAYVAPDGVTPLESVEAVLRETLGSVPLVVTIGVPFFYYAGMMVEVDVYGSLDPPSNPGIHHLTHGASAARITSGGNIYLRLDLPPGAASSSLGNELERILEECGSSLDLIVSAHVFLNRDLAATSILKTISETLGSDAGAAVLADLPQKHAAVVDLVAEAQSERAIGGNCSRATELAEIQLVERRAGHVLGLAARCLGSQPGLAAATRRIMEALSQALARHGLSFANVVKQQTYYLGGANEGDLYENMHICNDYYNRPGPASTGLAVHGFADPDCRITVELLAIFPP